MTQAAAASIAATSALPWHLAFARQCLEAKLAEATMVVGRPGDGLSQLCCHLAGELLGAEGDARGMMERKEHPDFHQVELGTSAAGKPRKEIVISQIRDLIDRIQLTPVLSSRRVVVIVPACRMNVNAANALLKMLEEPPAAVRMILGCEHPDRLPATIRSRCRRVMAPRPQHGEAVKWLDEHGIKKPEQLLELVNGAPLDALASEGMLPQYSRLASLCAGKTALADYDFAHDQVEPAVWIPWAMNWAARQALAASGLGSGKARQAEPASALDWLDLYRACAELLPLANHPVNPRLLVEYVIIRFQNLRRR